MKSIFAVIVLLLSISSFAEDSTEVRIVSSYAISTNVAEGVQKSLQDAYGEGVKAVYSEDGKKVHVVTCGFLSGIFFDYLAGKEGFYKLEDDGYCLHVLERVGKYRLELEVEWEKKLKMKILR